MPSCCRAVDANHHGPARATRPRCCSERSSSARAASHWRRPPSKIRTEFAEAEHITKDTLASLLRRATSSASPARMTSSLDRRTVNYVHTIIHRAFKNAGRWGRLARNPADAANPPKSGQKSDGIKAWSAESLRSFLAASAEAEDRLHALWVLLGPQACGGGEALGLRWSDLDLDAGRLRVVQTLIQTRSKVTVGEPKTGAGPPPDLARQGNGGRVA